MISHHAALVYTMVLVSAADEEMTDAELRTMGEIVSFLPIFADYDPALLPATASACAEMLTVDDGLEQTLEIIKQSLPARLCETAYAVACDIAATDGVVSEGELRILEMIRHRLCVDRLSAAAIERGARARFTTLEGTPPEPNYREAQEAV